MGRYTSSQMGFPRFRGAVRNLILITAAIYVIILLARSFAPQIAGLIVSYGALSPEAIRHYWLWQFFTYGFIDWDPLNFLFSMLAVYFLGAAVEERTGSRAFVELYLTSLVGAGVLGFLLSFTRVVGNGVVLGAGAAANGILMVFFLLYRDAPIMLFPLPIPIPVKYIVIFTAAVEAAYLLISHFALFYLVLLLGLGMGYVWYAFMWRHSFVGMFQGQALSARNRYYRWKRRRAGKKFQVYMRKHNQDATQYFDEYGNFRPPDDDDKKTRGPGGWVN